MSVPCFSTRRSRCASICRARPRCSLRCARRNRPLLQLKPARRPARETARPRSARRGAARLTAEAGASAAHALCAPRHLHRRHLRVRRLRAPALPRWRAMRMSRAALAGAVRKKVPQRSMCETRAAWPWPTLLAPRAEALAVWFRRLLFHTRRVTASAASASRAASARAKKRSSRRRLRRQPSPCQLRGPARRLSCRPLCLRTRTLARRSATVTFRSARAKASASRRTAAPSVMSGSNSSAPCTALATSARPSLSLAGKCAACAHCVSPPPPRPPPPPPPSPSPQRCSSAVAGDTSVEG